MAVDLELQANELLEILVDVLLVGLHALGERGALHLLGGKRPALLGLRHLEDLGHADAGLLDAGEVERLVEDVALGLGDVEDLDDAVARVIDHLVAATDKLHLVLRKLHAKPSLKGLGE